MVDRIHDGPVKVPPPQRPDGPTDLCRIVAVALVLVGFQIDVGVGHIDRLGTVMGGTFIAVGLVALFVWQMRSGPVRIAAFVAVLATASFPAVG